MTEPEKKSDIEQIKDGARALAVLFLVWPIAIFNSIARAYTMMVVWNWYMPNLGVQALALSQAFGLSVMAGLLTMKLHKPSKGYDAEHELKALLTRPLNMVVWCLLCLGLCYIALQIWGLP